MSVNTKMVSCDSFLVAARIRCWPTIVMIHDWFGWSEREDVGEYHVFLLVCYLDDNMLAASFWAWILQYVTIKILRMGMTWSQFCSNWVVKMVGGVWAFSPSENHQWLLCTCHLKRPRDPRPRFKSTCTSNSASALPLRLRLRLASNYQQLCNCYYLKIHNWQRTVILFHLECLLLGQQLL